jgi:hypothetical protein
MPGGFHAFVVSDEIQSLNFTKSFPEMREDFEGRDFVKAPCRMTKRFDVFNGNGFKELIAKLLKNTKRRWRSQLRKTMNYEDYESTLYSWIFVGTVGL